MRRTTKTGDGVDTNISDIIETTGDGVDANLSNIIETTAQRTPTTGALT